jgi:MarR family transcriptional regulator, lower aerobic nicotinate degradation pathway regulator
MRMREPPDANEPEPGNGASPNPSTPSYRLEEQVGFVLRRAHQRATDTFNTVMAGFKITPRQFAVMAKLDDLGPTSQNLLGRLVAMDPATMFGVAGRLAKRGLIKQAVDPHDARLVLLELTAEGRQVVQAMKARGLEVSRRTLEPLSAKEAETFLRLLVKMV